MWTLPKRIAKKAAALSNYLTSPTNDVHWYNNDTSTFVIQDWNGVSSWGWSVITFAAKNFSQKTRAYTIRSGNNGFWEAYRNNDGPRRFGAPIGDEIDVANTDSFKARDSYCNYDHAHGITSDERARCIQEYCRDTTVHFTAMQRFEKGTLCWDASQGTPCTVDGSWTQCANTAVVSQSLAGGAIPDDIDARSIPVIADFYSTDMGIFLPTTGLTAGMDYEAFNAGYPSGQLIPSGAIYPGFVMALTAGAWMQYSWGEYACIMANSTDSTSVSLRFNSLISAVAPVTYGLEQPATACGFNDDELVQCFGLTTDTNVLTFQGLQFSYPIDQLVITSSVTDDNFCFDTIWIEPDDDGDGYGITLDPDDAMSHWTGPESQYLFIDSDHSGTADPCVRRQDAILCDENRDGVSDYAFRYGDGISGAYFPTRHGVAVVFGYGTFYIDDNADGKTDRTMTFGVSSDLGHYLGNQGAVAIQRDTRYFVVDNNGDGFEEWYYPFGWGKSTQHYYLADMNGDGQVDLLFREGNLFTVDINHDGSDDYYFTYGKGDSDDYYLADWNGDGLADIIVRRGATLLILDNRQINRCSTCSNVNTWTATYGNGL